MQTGVREALLFHGLFFAIAAPVVFLTDGAAYGRAQLWLTAGYHLALPAWALMRGHTEWLWLWLFLLPLSVAQVVPDWVLVDVTRTLVFPDHGLPRIGGAVPVVFVGLWVMALFPILLVAQSTRHPYLVAAVISLPAFAVLEWTARPLQLWFGQNAKLFDGVAVYTLVPEMLLCLAALAAYRSLRGAALPVRVIGAVSVSVFYTGALLISLLLIG